LHDEDIVRQLCVELREIIATLTAKREFKVFCKPVDGFEFPDYYELVKKPMDLGRMKEKIDAGRYLLIEEFISDIDLIVQNAYIYNTDRSDIVHKVIDQCRSNLVSLVKYLTFYDYFYYLLNFISIFFYQNNANTNTNNNDKQKKRLDNCEIWPY